ncbi:MULTISPECIES: hypothetical protein [unclassified Streptomyces]|uniref:hypothetical protein n=1 Tax=unclassified Streptomyces TaxID=2593676 RepID=UPI00344A73CE
MEPAAVRLLPAVTFDQPTGPLKPMGFPPAGTPSRWRQVEIDPTVVIRNPAMWHRLDTDTRASIRRGTLLHGATALRQLTQRIDRETAHTVFKASGLQ